MFQSDENTESKTKNDLFGQLSSEGYQRRRSRRYICDNLALVTDVRTKTTRLAKLLNISESGLALAMELDLDIDLQAVHIEIFDGDELCSLVVKGEVKYTNGQSSHMMLGVEFGALSKLTVQRIQAFSEVAEEYC